MISIVGVALLQHGIARSHDSAVEPRKKTGSRSSRAASEQRLEDVAARDLAVRAAAGGAATSSTIGMPSGKREEAAAVGVDERRRALGHGDVVDVRRQHEAAQAALRPRHDEVDRLVVLDTMREHPPIANAPYNPLHRPSRPLSPHRESALGTRSPSTMDHGRVPRCSLTSMRAGPGRRRRLPPPSVVRVSRIVSDSAATRVARGIARRRVATARWSGADYIPRPCSWPSCRRRRRSSTAISPDSPRSPRTERARSGHHHPCV